MSDDNDNDLVFIEGGEEDEEEQNNNNDELLKQSELVQNNGLIENTGKKRVPFDSASYYKEKDKSIKKN
jgi:hypothetical protein